MGIKGPRTPRGRTHYESPCGTQALRGKDVFLLTEVIEDTWQYLFIKALRLGLCNLDTSRAQEPAAEIAGHRRRGRRGEGDHSHDAWMKTQP